MQLNGQNNGRAVVLVAYRVNSIQGYAVKTREGWTCVGALGMSWTKWKCRSLEDARCWLRMGSNAGRFQTYSEIEDLNKLLLRLSPHEMPGIMPEQIGGIPARLPKLGASSF